MRKLILGAAALAAVTAILSFSSPDPEPFLEKPYLQLGDSPKLSSQESLVLVWHTTSSPADWKVEVRTSKDKQWRAAGSAVSQTVSAPQGQAWTTTNKEGVKKENPAPAAIAPHLVYRAKLTNLVPGEEFHYRVLKGGTQVFDAVGHSRKSAGQSYRFALFGDCGQGTPSENAIAYQTWLAKPDFLFIPGDIVYGSGRISEYRDRFFPNYNSEDPSIKNGAPLLRSVPFIAAPGNHDTALQNFQRYPDALAYFLYWDQPLNGPVPPAGAAKTTHTLTGTTGQSEFLEGSKPRYPRMANFSFDYGNSHWTVLDANTYMDWSNPALREWLTKDLASAQSAAWRFVAFHQPGFNSSKEHFNEQYMRQLSPIFEAGHVDIVFAGHVHNYQRSFPMTFIPKPQPDGAMVGARGEMTGDWTLDKKFRDGADAKPQGVIYIVSGAGGAGLYNPEQQTEPTSWQPFTDKFISQVHSLSVVDVKGKTFQLKQVSENGDVVDSFRITK
jgi:hypothetical protein